MCTCTRIARRKPAGKAKKKGVGDLKGFESALLHYQLVAPSLAARVAWGFLLSKVCLVERSESGSPEVSGCHQPHGNSHSNEPSKTSEKCLIQSLLLSTGIGIEFSWICGRASSLTIHRLAGGVVHGAAPFSGRIEHCSSAVWMRRERAKQQEET